MKTKFNVLAVGLALTLATILNAQVGEAGEPERLFLQLVTPNTAVVKWRGGDADEVCWAKKLKDLEKADWPKCMTGVDTAGGHKEALLVDLAADTSYFYSVGGTVDADQVFRTATDINKPPKDGNTHIWLVGDSGTITEGGHEGEAAAVLAGFEAYNAGEGGGEPVDLFVALGDNAYEAGTDAEWQGSYFELYADILKSAFAITTIGNHEMGYGPLDLCFFVMIPCGIQILPIAGVSDSADPASYDGNGDLVPDGTGMPYLDIFSLPAAGESGGVPSGTEQYYSVDYGNVHLVSLDTQLTTRDDAGRAAMEAWLVADLAANTRDWTIVIFHHPPYTKGANHNSDIAEFSPFDRPEWDMRVGFTPIFETYGVDVVYSGHSHSYERSFYIKDHTGTSDTFDPAIHAELNPDGTPALGYGAETYEQLSPTSGGVDDRVVYTVNGSSGKADDDNGQGGITPPEEWLRHAAHVTQPADTECANPDGCRQGLAVLGSVVLDASKDSLTAKMIDVNGTVLDQFTINR